MSVNVMLFEQVYFSAFYCCYEIKDLGWNSPSNIIQFFTQLCYFPHPLDLNTGVSSLFKIT